MKEYMGVRSNQSTVERLTERIRELEEEKKQLEQTIQELQQQFTRANFPMIVVNENQEITFINEATCRYLHVEDRLLIGKHISELILFEADFCHNELERSGRTVHPVQIVLSDGKIKPVLLEKVEKRKSGSIYFIHDQSCDTKKKMNLPHSVLESISEHFRDCLLLLDSGGMILYANPVFYEIFALSGKPCVGQTIASFFPDRKQDEYQDILEQIRSSGEPFSTTLSLRKGSCSKIFDATIYYNDFERMFILILRDRTELMNMYQLMNVTLQRIYTAFDRMVDGMIVWSNRSIPGQLTSCFERIFEQNILYEADDLKIFLINKMGKKILSFRPELPASEQLEKLIILEKNEEFRFPVYLQHLHKNCGPHIVHLHTGDDQTLGLEVYHLPNIVDGLHVTVFRDITERLALEDNLRQSEMLHVLGELAAGVAHEIRNPMTSLKGFIQLLEASVDGYTMYFKIILSELERIESIVNEFLVLAKPQAVQYQYYDVVKIMKDTIELLGPEAALENVRIHTFFPRESVKIFCEPNQIKQVFINIVKNAIEVMAGGGNIRIRIQREANSPYVRVSIRDEGEGIPKERLEKLGQPFYTSKERGTGLGLMVSYKIVKEHGGKITVNSKVGRGTVFHIYLPERKLGDQDKTHP